MNNGDGPSALRGYRGAVERGHPEYDRHIGGPLNARVRVVPLDGGRLGFEVLAEWTGKGLRGLPPVEGGVDCSDCYIAERLGPALAIAHGATHQLRCGLEPDLVELAKRVHSDTK
jgi:hypothetical protein